MFHEVTNSVLPKASSKVKIEVEICFHSIFIIYHFLRLLLLRKWLRYFNQKAVFLHDFFVMQLLFPLYTIA